MRRFMLFSLVLLLAACSGKKNNPSPPRPASLLTPLQNSVCTSGNVISNTQSEVTFTWQAAMYADSYELHITDLLTEMALPVQTTASTKLNVTLSRAAPYSWFVVSRSSRISTTANSDTWKFYNSGPGVVNYAPFPADITSPAFGVGISAMNGMVNLEWIGSDVNNDIAGYDVYFGTTNTPPLLKSGVTAMFLNNVAVTSGTTYYWKVITKDQQGNTSDSGVYQFSVM